MTDVLQDVKFMNPYTMKIAQQTIQFVRDRANIFAASEVDVLMTSVWILIKQDVHKPRVFDNSNENVEKVLQTNPDQEKTVIIPSYSESKLKVDNDQTSSVDETPVNNPLLEPPDVEQAIVPDNDVSKAGSTKPSDKVGNTEIEVDGLESYTVVEAEHSLNISTNCHTYCINTEEQNQTAISTENENLTKTIIKDPIDAHDKPFTIVRNSDSPDKLDEMDLECENVDDVLNETEDSGDGFLKITNVYGNVFVEPEFNEKATSVEESLMPVCTMETDEVVVPDIHMSEGAQTDELNRSIGVQAFLPPDNGTSVLKQPTMASQMQFVPQIGDALTPVMMCSNIHNSAMKPTMWPVKRELSQSHYSLIATNQHDYGAPVTVPQTVFNMIYKPRDTISQLKKKMELKNQTIQEISAPSLIKAPSGQLTQTIPYKIVVDSISKPRPKNVNHVHNKTGTSLTKNSPGFVLNEPPSKKKKYKKKKINPNDPPSKRRLSAKSLNNLKQYHNKPTEINKLIVLKKAKAQSLNKSSATVKKKQKYYQNGATSVATGSKEAQSIKKQSQFPSKQAKSSSTVASSASKMASIQPKISTKSMTSASISGSKSANSGNRKLADNNKKASPTIKTTISSPCANSVLRNILSVPALNKTSEKDDQRNRLCGQTEKDWLVSQSQLINTESVSRSAKLQAQKKINELSTFTN